MGNNLPILSHILYFSPFSAWLYNFINPEHTELIVSSINNVGTPRVSKDKGVGRQNIRVGEHTEEQRRDHHQSSIGSGEAEHRNKKPIR